METYISQSVYISRRVVRIHILFMQIKLQTSNTTHKLLGLFVRRSGNNRTLC